MLASAGQIKSKSLTVSLYKTTPSSKLLNNTNSYNNKHVQLNAESNDICFIT
jgi:hypothetical protein